MKPIEAENLRYTKYKENALAGWARRQDLSVYDQFEASVLEILTIIATARSKSKWEESFIKVTVMLTTCVYHAVKIWNVILLMCQFYIRKRCIYFTCSESKVWEEYPAMYATSWAWQQLVATHSVSSQLFTLFYIWI